MRFAATLFVALGFSAAIQGQQITDVPRLIRFNGSYQAANRQTQTPVIGATFSIFREETDGTPLWSEIQNIQPDKDGLYTALLGSTRGEGMPVELFMTTEPRWLEVEIDQIKQPRVLLGSVPYALKASDADTLGGLPPSAYLRASTLPSTFDSVGAVGASLSPLVDNGSAGCIPVFVNVTDLNCSVLNQSGAAVSIGIPTTYYGALTLVGNVPFGDAAGMALYNAGAGAGASVSLDMYNTAANSGIPQAKIKAIDDGNYSDNLTFWTKTPGGSSNPVTEKVRFTSTGNVGIGTTNPSQKLEVNGTGKFDSGIMFGDGTVQTTAATSGGGGSITAVTAGTDLTGGGTGGAVALNLDTTKVPQLNTGNSFIGNQGISGNLITTGSGKFSGGIAFGDGTTQTTAAAVTGVNAGADLTGGGASGSVTLSLDTTKVPLLNNANTFSANQTDLGNLTVGGNINLSGAIYSGASGVPIFQSPTDGSQNFGAGYQALQSVTYGSGNGANNVGVGYQALHSNTVGDYNTALGSQGLAANTNGFFNVAVGGDALQYLESGIDNTAVGTQALWKNTAGSENVAVGHGALYVATGGSNIGIGTYALAVTTGSNNIGIGVDTGMNLGGGSNNIYIANNVATSESGVIRIGQSGGQTSTFIAGITGVNISGVPVLVSSSGQLGVASSSRRFKKDIQDMGDATSDLMRLRPVTYHYRQAFDDGSEPLQYGLIAEEVAEVYPELVAHSADGQIETVKYQVLDSMLLNELQKQNATITSQKEKILSLEQRLSRLESLLERANQNVNRAEN